MSALPRLFASSLLLALPVSAQEVTAPPTLDGALRSEIVAQLGELLERHYIFPDVARTSAEMLALKLEGGAFDERADPADFAEALTRTLRASAQDKHLSVRFQAPAPKDGGEGPESLRAARLARLRAENYGFEKLEHLDGNVGYLDLRAFAPLEHARATAAGAMAFLANADAIIVDLRANGGGDPAMVQFLCSYFFGEKTHLNNLFWRAGGRVDEFWTLEELPGERRPDVPLFLLTSDYTFSAAEEFAYNLRTRERATIVGETTGGGANPGDEFALAHGLAAFIPTGRAVNPVTGTNWEGVGVEPHVATTADEALERALAEARRAAEAYRDAR